MLTRHVDILFDQGWLSFTDQDNMLVSAELEKDVLQQLGIQIKNVGGFRVRTCQYL